MPTTPKRPRSVAKRSQSAPLAEAQAELLAQFDRLITDSLGPLLGKARLAAVRRDLAIATSVGGGVVVHAGVKSKGTMTLHRIAKEKPIVGVLANTIPLIDPVTLATLKPGAYVVRIRPLGRDAVVFDYFTEKSGPVFSAVGEPTKPVPTDRTAPLLGLADVDVDLPWDPDSLSPPEDDTRGLFCMSILHWKKCWHWDWPDIDWPW